MITMSDIVREGHDVLRQKAKEVALPLSDEDKNTLKNLLEYVKQSQDEELSKKYDLRPGIGLAAPQINVSKRMIAIHVTDDKNVQHSYMLVNPKIISHSVEKTYRTAGEGCLSVDRNVAGYVPRHARITVSAYNIDGEKIQLRLKGLLAIVFQHEIDHLNGIMFYDHINKENPFAIPENSTPCEI